MSQWNISLELEVGAIKEWGRTAAVTFGAETPVWDRLIKLNGNIKSIAMDEPLASARDGAHQTDDQAVEETAKFVGLVRAKYPHMLVGDVEPYPSISLNDHFLWLANLRNASSP